MEQMNYEDIEIEVLEFEDGDIVVTSPCMGISCDHVQDICSTDV